MQSLERLAFAQVRLVQEIFLTVLLAVSVSVIFWILSNVVVCFKVRTSPINTLNCSVVVYCFCSFVRFSVNLRSSLNISQFLEMVRWILIMEYS